ncbi:MAG: phosphotransferase family protein [Planctomycetota bacterium]|jgi:tRNA A-37 threonylcarbamoyl transferase component Bud32
MEFVADIARKTGRASLLAVEAAKASRALEIGRDCGLFSVPRVVNFDAEAGVLEFERLRGLSTLLDLAVVKDARLPGLLGKTGQSLAAIHEKLTLPEEMKHQLPPPWMGSAGENVFIHGDFACINVCFHEPSGELVILDFSAAPMVGRTPTFGGRYFDIILLVSSLFHGAPCRRVFGWNAGGMAEVFLKGYAKVSPNTKLSTLRDYSCEMLRLQRENIRRASRERQPLSALFYTCCQMLMCTRFRSFLRKHEL